MQERAVMAVSSHDRQIGPAVRALASHGTTAQLSYAPERPPAWIGGLRVPGAQPPGTRLINKLPRHTVVGLGNPKGRRAYVRHWSAWRRRLYLT